MLPFSRVSSPKANQALPERPETGQCPFLKTAKIRADELLVSLGLAESRAKAKALVMSGKVRLGTERVDKPGRLLPEDTPLTVDTPPPYVSRGGEKLRGFLDHFPLSVEGLHVLDLGASTGGFTDCLLQVGAAGATCVDVGRAQLHDKLRRDPRVLNLEKTNVRHLSPGDLPLPAYPVIVMDLSFISLSKVLPAAWNFLEPEGHLIALVKPQFEATKQEADAGKGIIKDSAVHTRVLEETKTFAATHLPQSSLFAECESPIRGTNGNLEFFLAWRKANA